MALLRASEQPVHQPFIRRRRYPQQPVLVGAKTLDLELLPGLDAVALTKLGWLTTADIANVTNTGGLPIPPFNAIPVFGEGAIPNSTADYFHPSLLGQALLAKGSWNATFSMN